MRRDVGRRRWLATTVVILLALAGCSGEDGHSPEPTPAAAAPSPPSAPPDGACYDLRYRSALNPVDRTAPVPCKRRHTTETVYVGHIDPLADGHLLALDADRVQQQVASACRDRIDRHVGGTVQARRLSRLQPAWFGPTLEESDAGALWYRCDLVLLTGPHALGALPRKTAGLLSKADALDSYGTCGTASPSADRFRRVSCGEPHRWRARAAFELPAHGRYLQKAARARADTRCRDLDVRIAADALKLQWSFEWPTREQWEAGQRWGLCWTPDPA